MTDEEEARKGAFAELLRLDEIEQNLFRGWCHAGAPLRAFGGQVAAQALVAAGRTVGAERHVHSLHGYFMRPGDPRRPIVYEVDRVRDGRSYTTRRVTGVQNGEAIFTLSASFKVPEKDEGRQRTMPVVPPPEELPDPYPAWKELDPEGYAASHTHLAMDLRFVPRRAEGLPAEEPGMPEQFVWVRASAPLPDDDPLLQVCALAYMSDLTLAGTASLDRQPPRQKRARSELSVASLDHAMWFHRPFRADEWLLFAQRSPSASDGRGLALGEFYTRDGDLVASCVQEALVRERLRKPGESRGPEEKPGKNG
ncbi:acyl-CoA thioesterase [Phaeacidiphilus oryzae]|jgi:acyl-CoA thioesterase-2|uniref:acyl-CoA thioesterase n=1 Tax=Phaeacidiphilus oryzae TaxID=348818 RepID=UPI0005619BB0|nr:acyl-CoA thioesterase domain-containing protein [Phaeacidiphilus oryzae]